MTNLNSLQSHESSKSHSKTAKFIENTKRAVHKAITTTGIVASSFLPTSVNTITTTAPLAGTVVSTIGAGTAANLLTACSSDNTSEELKDTTSPEINLTKFEIDITGGKEIRIRGNTLYIGDELVATRKDDVTQNCSTSLLLNGKPITYGTVVSEDGTLTLQVSDAAGNATKVDIKLSTTPEAPISGLEKLKNLSLKVDQEIDLLKGITLGNGVEITKVEIESDGQKTEISDPHHYTPEYPGTCTIIITIQDKNGTLTTHKVENLSIAPLEYKSISIKNLKPADILPIIGQVEVGDEKCYEHIEHLRVAEATRIRDMMRKYGAGSHSPEQYQQLMSRLHTGMLQEYPEGYNNFEFIGRGSYSDHGTNHAHKERSILTTLLDHANLKCCYVTQSDMRRDKVDAFIKENPNTITILGCSAYEEETNRNDFLRRSANDPVKKLCTSKKVIIFRSGGNIEGTIGDMSNKVYHKDIDGDGNYGIYSLQSNANGKNDTEANIALLVTIGTNATGNIDQTGEIYSSSRFPVGFHDKVLFSGRAFPTHSLQNNGIIVAEGLNNNGKYVTSYTNYVNVALADLCFQMFAEAKDTDQLLDMIRSTCLTDHISLDGQTQPLQLINPAGFFQKYLMPTKLPTQIKQGETLSLSKGYYKGIIFDIPGAEVKINGKWIAYNDANKSLIQSQNPMNLERRLNGNLCKKLGYSSSKPIKGKIIVVDDQFKGLNISSDTTITTSF